MAAADVTPPPVTRHAGGRRSADEDGRCAGPQARRAREETRRAAARSRSSTSRRCASTCTAGSGRSRVRCHDDSLLLLAGIALLVATFTAASGTTLAVIATRSPRRRTMRRAALLALALALLVVPAAGAVGLAIGYTVTSGTAGDNGWYRSAVTVQITGDRTRPTRRARPSRRSRTNSDRRSTAPRPTATATIPFHLQFKIDTDAPSVSGRRPSRAADANGWFNHPVTLVVQPAPTQRPASHRAPPSRTRARTPRPLPSPARAATTPATSAPRRRTR